MIVLFDVVFKFNLIHFAAHLAQLQFKNVFNQKKNKTVILDFKCNVLNFAILSTEM